MVEWVRSNEPCVPHALTQGNIFKQSGAKSKRERVAHESSDRLNATHGAPVGKRQPE